MNGPRASKRAFLCELPCLPADTKVRFLGCVRQYNVTEGHLILEHNYLRGKEEANTVPVDINAVLEDVTSEELHVGAWLNVIGYVRDCHSPSASFSSSQLDAQSQHSNDSSSAAKVPSTIPSRPVYIDAVLVYPAGAIALGEYERILRNLLDVERRMQFVG